MRRGYCEFPARRGFERHGIDDEHGATRPSGHRCIVFVTCLTPVSLDNVRAHHGKEPVQKPTHVTSEAELTQRSASMS